MNDISQIDDLLRGVAALARVENRVQAADELAARLGSEHAMLFVRDDVVGRPLPAVGFPQTLLNARAWRRLVDEAMEHGVARGEVTLAEGVVRAVAIGVADGTVFVIAGGEPDEAALGQMAALLPLLGALFRNEATARQSKAETTIARQSAAQATELAAKLDATRFDLQRALSVAETATRARDEFLATVSHELRTPLTSIIGWIQLLRDDEGGAHLSEGLDTIERNARTQSRLIEDILDYSRISAGKLHLDVRNVEMSEIAQAAIEVIRPAADARGIRLSFVYEPGAGAISGDPDRLQQVVWNLVANAVKFTERGGEVVVAVSGSRSDCQLTVRDTGVGIAPEFLPYVFDRFSQADSSSTRSHSGLGLGLGIVRHLVELHGGSVEALSDGIGSGATFVVRLPLRELVPQAPGIVVAESPRLDALSIPVSSSEIAGVAVLLLEDNDDARKLLSVILSRAGAVVHAAESVSTALRLFSERRPDVVISDIELPGEDGYSFIRKLKVQAAGGSPVPAIALTAYARSVDRDRALAEGFQLHIAKPVDTAELVAAVRSLVAVKLQV